MKLVIIQARGMCRSARLMQKVALQKQQPREEDEKFYQMRPLKDIYAENKTVFYKERTIKVHTCKDLFSKWKGTKPGYEHVNPDGLVLDVPFIHSGLDRGRSGGAPTVLAVHGAPGTHRDFDSVIPVMDFMGANVIVPTFPDLHFSMKTQNFWHSLEEKTDLLKSYVEKMNITEIDMLISHSSAMYSALQLALYTPGIKVNSMVFIAPAGCRQLTQLSPLPLFHWFDRQFRKPHLQKAMVGLATGIIKAYGKPSTDTVGTVASMITMIQQRYDDAEPWCRDLYQREIPSLLFYGKRDKLIDVSISEEMASYLGNSNKESFFVYDGKDDREASEIQKGAANYSSAAEVVCFKSGSHFAFKKFPDTFNYHMANFFNRQIREKRKK